MMDKNQHQIADHHYQPFDNFLLSVDFGVPAWMQGYTMTAILNESPQKTLSEAWTLGFHFAIPSSSVARRQECPQHTCSKACSWQLPWTWCQVIGRPSYLIS
jgi:hypothetical protein